MPGLLHHFSRDTERQAIEKFWTWWAVIKPEVAAAIDAETVRELSYEISTAVRAISPRLMWGVMPGISSKYLLCLSGGPIEEYRSLAERAIHSAPQDDTQWGYLPARPPRPRLSRSMFAGSPVASGEDLDLRFLTHVNTASGRLDTIIWHPVFANLREKTRAELAFLFVDGVLGEDYVETWLGEINPVASEPPHATNTVGFFTAVQALEAAGDT